MEGFINNMRIQKSNNYQHAGCRLYPCNILNSSHLNHFWVQPEIFKVLPRVLGLALTLCDLFCKHLIIKK